MAPLRFRSPEEKEEFLADLEELSRNPIFLLHRQRLEEMEQADYRRLLTADPHSLGHLQGKLAAFNQIKNVLEDLRNEAKNTV